MCTVGLSIPNEVLFDTKMNEKQTNEFARKAVALCYYTQAGVSLGYCAQIAGMSKGEFIKYLGSNHISIFSFDDKEELLEEVNNA
ncbi:MAG: UPF0175 family protein [Parasporobacterium sp.]|nr:UPF0175 family protein [Parasporobacterium sp.]